ncbi:DUF5919 domain-containing protein, partial [Streptomyces sp. NPDC050388]|uniref:DUF5919 domain-containing protein n=1 Tax=Streptomyces sp. NPDC050388 TaxID=3155781 RepID=UPI00342BF718
MARVRVRRAGRPRHREHSLLRAADAPAGFEIQVYDETPRCTAYLVDGDGA